MLREKLPSLLRFKARNISLPILFKVKLSRPHLIFTSETIKKSLLELREMLRFI